MTNWHTNYCCDHSTVYNNVDVIALSNHAILQF